MDEITIHIFIDSEGNYQYNIFNLSPEQVASDRYDSLDGGCCTTTMQNAIDMAADQAKKLV